MRILIKTLGWLLTLTLLAIAGLAVMVFLDSRPLVPQDRTLTGAERAWAHRWLAAARPRDRRDGEHITLTLSEDQANILGAYLIDHLGQGRVAVRLEHNRGRLAASLGLPWDPQRRFINLELSLIAGERLPRIEQVRFAGLPLPGGLAQTLAERLTAALDQSGLIERVELQQDLARLTYEWHRDNLATVGSGLVSADDRARVLRYQDQLIRYGAGRPKDAAIPLPDLLALVLTAAGRQDAAAAAAPTQNRAALLALAAYVNGQRIRDPAQAAATATDPVFRTVELRGRHDLAQHFMTSAALTVQGGNTLSDLIGLYKEVSDSRGGSGFSFADLTADRAGTRFGDLAGGAAAQALQRTAARGLADADIMPAIDGLPEGLSATAFAAAFQDTRSPTYRHLTDHIERRIDALPLFQAATR